MRMSDWSSDVCSSDLFGPTKPLPLTLPLRHHFAPHDATDPDPVSLRRALKLGPRLGKYPEQTDDDIAVESKTAHFLSRFLSSEERAEVNEGGSACRSGWSPYH